MLIINCVKQFQMESTCILSTLRLIIVVGFLSVTLHTSCLYSPGVAAAPASTHLLDTKDMRQSSLIGACQYSDRFNCATDWKSETLDMKALQTCEACANYWSNVIGMAWCCRCNPKVFAFCWSVVNEQPALG